MGRFIAGLMHSFFHWTDAQHFFKSTFSLFQQIFSSLAASFLSSHAKNEKEQKTGPFKFKFCQHENRLKRSESGFCRRRHSPDFHFEMTFFFWWQEQQQRRRSSPKLDTCWLFARRGRIFAFCCNKRL